MSTVAYCKDKRDVVEYVEDMLTSLNNVSPLIMTITRGKSEGYSVFTATEGSLDATDVIKEQNSFLQHTNISPPNTPDG